MENSDVSETRNTTPDSGFPKTFYKIGTARCTPLEKEECFFSFLLTNISLSTYMYVMEVD
jgi:hypothetical protein